MDEVKVWVVWGPLYEKVVSVHKTEDGADARAEKEDKDRIGKTGYLHEIEDFRIEQ